MYISIYIYIYYIKRMNGKSYNNFATVVMVCLTFWPFFFLWMHKVVVYLLYYFWFVHNNFHNTFIKNQIWSIVIGYNLNLSMRLLFCSPITTCSNLLLMICCENVMDITFFCVKNVKISWCCHNIFKIAELSILYKLK